MPVSASSIRSRAFLRAAFAFWLLVAFFGIRIASATHPHDDDGGHCCPVCHVGHIPIVTTNSTVQVIRQDVLVSRVCAEAREATQVHRATLQISRAPPVSLIIAA